MLPRLKRKLRNGNGPSDWATGDYWQRWQKVFCCSRRDGNMMGVSSPEQEEGKWKQWVEADAVGNFVFKWGSDQAVTQKEMEPRAFPFFSFLSGWETLYHVCTLTGITLLEDTVVIAFFKFSFVCFCVQWRSKRSYHLGKWCGVEGRDNVQAGHPGERETREI